MFLYLFDIVLVNLEINPLDFVRRLDLNATQERLEKVQHGAGALKEPGEPVTINHEIQQSLDLAHFVRHHKKVP